MEDKTSIPHLFSTLMRDFSILVQKEIELARVEISGKMNQMTNGAISLAAGGMIAFSGFLFLLLAATYGLENWVEPWLAALIVGAVVTIIGLIMVSAGKKKVQPNNLAPRRAVESVRDDVRMARTHTPRGS